MTATGNRIARAVASKIFEGLIAGMSLEEARRKIDGGCINFGQDVFDAALAAVAEEYDFDLATLKPKTNGQDKSTGKAPDDHDAGQAANAQATDGKPAGEASGEKPREESAPKPIAADHAGRRRQAAFRRIRMPHGAWRGDQHAHYQHQRFRRLSQQRQFETGPVAWPHRRGHGIDIAL